MSIANAIGAAIGFGLGGMGGIAKEAFFGWADPQIAASSQKWWSQTPTIPPPISGILRAHQQGYLNDGDANRLARLLGVNFRGGRFRKADAGKLGAAYANSWEAVYQTMFDFPSAEAVIQSWQRGFLPDGKYIANLTRAGGKRIHWEPFYDALRYWLPPGQLIELLNRRLIDEPKFRDWFRKLGGSTDEVQGLMRRLAAQMPPISDVIRFAVKDVFDPEIRNALGLTQEFPPVVQGAAEALGYGRWQDATDHPLLKDLDLTAAQAYWAAHWQPISPTQAYTMLQRIRPYNLAKFRAAGWNVNEFTANDVRRWLKIDDYPPAIRDYLGAISYRVLTRVDVRRMFRIGVLTKDEVKEAYLDLGYTQTDAQRLADFTEINEKNTANSANLRTFRTQVLANYRAGTIDRQGARNRLVITCSPKLKPQECETEIAFLLDSVDLQVNADLVNRAIKALRADFLEGAVTLEEARTQLIGMGLYEPRISQYLQSWRIDFTRPRQVASTAKICEWFNKRLISEDEAVMRMRNLGWRDNDIRLHLSACNLPKIKYGPAKRPEPTEPEPADTVEGGAGTDEQSTVPSGAGGDTDTVPAGSSNGDGTDSAPVPGSNGDGV